MKSITPLSKIMMFNYKSQKFRGRPRRSVRKIYRLSKKKFALYIIPTRNTATSVVSFNRKLSIYRNANLFNSTAHYSQSRIMLFKPFGFIQQRRKVIHKRYRIIGVSKTKKNVVEKDYKYKKTNIIEKIGKSKKGKTVYK